MQIEVPSSQSSTTDALTDVSIEFSLESTGTQLDEEESYFMSSSWLGITDRSELFVESLFEKRIIIFFL